MKDSPVLDIDASNADPTQRLLAGEPDPTKGGDVYGWAMEQVALIRAGRYAEVDWVNVADEIESVAKSELRAVSSNLVVLLIHMLKWDHQPALRGRSGILSIDEHRARVLDDLEDNPSMRTKLDGVWSRTYRSGHWRAAEETGLPVETFPKTCPYDWDAIMTRPFVLDQTDETA